MTWIRRRIEGSFPIPSLTLEGLLTTPLEQLGLKTDPDSIWLQSSMPLFGDVKWNGVTLHCHRSKIRALGRAVKRQLI